MAAKTKDVIIAGGGLAGLSLAHQLKTSKPELDILVVERNQFPVPEKTAKVGESTVEIGSRYLKKTLGLEKQFTDRHLRKHGLRCFFGEPQADFSQQDELGVSQLFGIPTYQIDRGAIENQLQTSISNNGVEVLDGVSTKSIQIDGNEPLARSKPFAKNKPLASNKSLTIETDSGEQTYQSRWLIDAAGRQALIKNKLGLKKGNNHQGNALWFRVDRQIKLDEWSNSADWHDRIKQPNTRWLSTNHLMGPGYWVWVIPLDNGATSIGVVMDDEVFSSWDFSTVDGATQWLEKNQPHCAQAIEGAPVLDYVVINDYSHSCKQLFSEQGWGVTGESGVFADPFYSPGSDFIAFNNTFINQLVCDSFDGKDIRLQSRLYETINQSFFSNTLSLYTGQYGGFGDRRMMSLKLVWDYAYYWGVLSLLFFRSAITDVEIMRDLNPLLQRASMANAKVQSAFRERAKQRLMLPAKGVFMNQYMVPCLKHFSDVLDDDTLAIKKVLPDNVDKIERLETHVINLLTGANNATISSDEFSLLGDYRNCVLA